MAQYIDTDSNPNNRTFAVSADNITVSVAGVSKSMVVGGSVAFIAQVASPFASLTAAADAHNALLTALKNAGVMAAS